MRVRYLALTLAFVACDCLLAQGRAPEQPSGWVDKQAVSAKHFMVVAAHPLASEAGYAILKQGGNAIDAAVAVQLVLNLAEPQSSGIGGGNFIMHYDGTAKKLSAYDGRETAPAAARPDRFLGPDGKPVGFVDAVVGGRSVGVPGTLRALELAHQKHGKLPWAELFVSAIRLARDGFVVSPRLARALAREPYLARQAEARTYFHNADGTPLRAGQRLVNLKFADVLGRIAAGGSRVFYEGEIARDIVAAIRSAPNNPGDMTEADLAEYRAKERAPVCGTYRGDKVCGFPAPSSGAMAVLQILGMLEHFDMGAASYTKPSERLMQLNDIAIGQLRSLVGNSAIKRLGVPKDQR